MAFKELYKAFVDLAGKNHLNNVDCFLVGHSHAVFKFALFANSVQHSVDFGTAAVNQYNVDSDELHKNEVVHYGRFQIFVYHGVSAVFNYNSFACPFFDVWHGLN